MEEHVKVFISYSHDSAAHRERVLALADRLRRDGIDCALDLYEMAPAEGWSLWMERRIEESAFVLLVCTETYWRRASGREHPEVGHGARFESVLIVQSLYDAGMLNAKFLPIVFDDGDCAFIPLPLRTYTEYRVDGDEGYEELLRRLTGQPEVVPPELGATPHLLPRAPAGSRSPAAPSRPVPDAGATASAGPSLPPAKDLAQGGRAPRRRRLLAGGIALGIALLLVVASAGWWTFRLPQKGGRRSPDSLPAEPAPQDPGAARAYGDGRRRLQCFELLQAKDDLEKAVRAEDDFPFAHAALGETYKRLGNLDAASVEAEKAQARARGVPENERLAVEAICRWILNDWTSALDAYKRLPDTLENGLMVVEILTGVGHGEEALKKVAALHRLSSDPRIDLFEALAANTIHDYRRQLEAASHATEKAEARGLEQLAARARLPRGIALFMLGHTPQALDDFLKANRAAASGSDFNLAAQAMNAAGNALKGEGKLTEAGQQYREALAAYETNGLGSPSDRAYQLNGLAAVAGSLGNLGVAREGFERAAELFHEEEDPENEARASLNLGIVLRRQGELGRADAKLRSALRLVGKNESIAAEVHFALGELKSAQGDLPAAIREHQTAFAKLKNLTGTDGLAESRLARARLPLEEGIPGMAKEAAVAAAEAARKELPGEPQREAEAQALIAEAALRLHDLPAAQRAVAEANRLADKTEEVQVRIAVALAEARVLAAEGRAQEGIKLLGRVLAETEKKGLVASGFEVRLAQGEIELTRGDRPRGRQRLAALVKDAEAAGFKRVAGEAAKALTAGGA